MRNHAQVYSSKYRYKIYDEEFFCVEFVFFSSVYRSLQVSQQKDIFFSLLCDRTVTMKGIRKKKEKKINEQIGL